MGILEKLGLRKKKEETENTGIKRNVRLDNYNSHYPDLQKLISIRRLSFGLINQLENIFAEYNSTALSDRDKLSQNQDFVKAFASFCTTYNQIVKLQSFCTKNNFLSDEALERFAKLFPKNPIMPNVGNTMNMDKVLDTALTKFNGFLILINPIIEFWLKEENKIALKNKGQMKIKGDFAELINILDAIFNEYNSNWKNKNYHYFSFLNKGQSKTILAKRVVLNKKYPRVVILLSRDDEYYVVGFSQIIKIEDSLNQVHYSKEN